MTDTDRREIILIVDDTPENLRLLAGMLGEKGYDARPVTSGHDALEAMSHEAPDLVLLDVTMPEMDGFEVCRRIKANPSWHDIPVIFLTALANVEDKMSGFSVGGVDYVTKPFHMDEVMARAASQLALRRARQALADSFARLQALERLRDDLVKMIVHDMRGLLLVVNANIEIALPDISGEPHQFVSDAMSASNEVVRMANTLLDVSRMEEGKMPLKRSRVDVAALGADVARTFAVVDTTRSIVCSATTPVMANCDAGLIRRVLDNLVGNGMKHTPAGGTLNIAVEPRDGRVRVAVIDRGPGVPEELRERIFEKFAAGRKETKHHSAGLGLAFCRLAVEAHGGTIGVEAALPRGSVFAFEIPA
jgi:two-component system sensor histidine kinase/response regulator